MTIIALKRNDRLFAGYISRRVVLVVCCTAAGGGRRDVRGRELERHRQGAPLLPGLHEPNGHQADGRGSTEPGEQTHTAPVSVCVQRVRYVR